MCTSILESLLPKVVNCKKAYFNTEYGIPSTQVFDPSSPEYDSQYVYIGRWSYQIQIQSKWANPFAIGKDRDGTREQVVDKFRTYILNQLNLLAAIIPELTGKYLCCWCVPELCHGNVLVELWQQQKQHNIIKEEIY
jgi:hypothetical protein